MAKISKLIKMEWQGVCKDYTLVEVSQDLDKNIVELRQPTYWEQLGKNTLNTESSHPSRLSRHYQTVSKCRTQHQHYTKQLST